MMTIGILPSALKVMYYRLKGMKIGRGVSIGLGSIIDSDDVQIEEGTSIGPLCFIKARRLRVGKRVRLNMLVAIDTGAVEIGDDVVIMEQVVVGGMLTPRSRFSIGKRCKVFPYCFINPTEPITIQDDVGIGGSTYIFTHGSWQSILDGFPVSFGPVTIKQGVWFPWRVFVMPNVTVGEYATIGAGSIITRDIPAHTLAVGTPAKPIKQGSEYVKSFTRDQKVQIVIDILGEFADYLEYLGKSASVKTGDSCFELAVDENGEAGLQRILFCDSLGSSSPQAEIIVSLDALPNGASIQLATGSRMWFDVSRRLCSMPLDWLGQELKDFFSRYGVRFEPVESLQS
jgi:acetyltransferase-like isoleucine patch superfamily enzyme